MVRWAYFERELLRMKELRLGRQSYKRLGTCHSFADKIEGKIPKWVLDWIKPHQVALNDAVHGSRVLILRGRHYKSLRS